MASITKCLKSSCPHFQSTRSAHQHKHLSALRFVIVGALILQLRIQSSLGDDELSSLSSSSAAATATSGQNNATSLSLSGVVAKPQDRAAPSIANEPTKTSATDDTSESQPESSTIVPNEEALSGAGDKDEGNVEAALAAAAAKRTTSKQDPAPATEPSASVASTQETTTIAATQPASTTGKPVGTTAPSGQNSDQVGQSGPQQQEQSQQNGGRLLEGLTASIDTSRQLGSGPASLSPGLSKTLGDIVQQLPAVYSTQQANSSMSTQSILDDPGIKRLLPAKSNLFDKDAIDATQMGEMGCHLRNLDYCLAGLLGTSQKVLPENDRELETRCDEMKATTSCMAVYNKRCGTLKLFSILAPFAQQSTQALAPNSNSPLLNEPQRQLLASSMENADAVLARNGANSSASSSMLVAPPSLGGLMGICEPNAKNSTDNRQTRQRLFQMAKCINARIPKLSPCLEDLKTALQVFYEPRRVLPMRPTCCALARLRACSTEALDGVCGLSSFEQVFGQLSGQMGQSNGPLGMIKAIERVCRQATDHRSQYCGEVLPPSGMKVPPKRGSKASKLARALDLISFAPATQDLSAF